MTPDTMFSIANTVALVSWLMLYLDLSIGCWEVGDARERGVPMRSSCPACS
jgi:hypothetical protein